jgi:tetratricopeptide (TPR) repeat protein
MKIKKHTLLLFIIVAFAIPFNDLFSQAVQIKPTRQSSFEAYSQGNYEKAYTEFRELLLTYSKDPLYQYYSGVCLVKLNREPNEAIKLLQLALQSGGNVKTLPSDGLFYLGRAQQMAGKFSDAIQSYNLYIDHVGKKASKELGVQEFLDQCARKTGQIAENSAKPVEIKPANKSDSIKNEAKPSVTPQIQQPVEKTQDKKTALPENYDRILNDAIEYQFKADSVTALVTNQRKEMEKLSGPAKSALYARLLDNEKTASAFQNSANQKYHEAQLMMSPKQESSNVKNQNTIKTINDRTIDSSKNSVIKPVEAEKKPDTSKIVTSPIKAQVQVFSFFDISGISSTDPTQKIILNPEVPPGLIYRIQLAVFRNPVTPDFFKGIIPIYGFRIEGTDKTIYYAGMFRKYSDAVKALREVKSKGFKDAFIAPLMANKRVSSERATVLEKEWGQKPFYSIEKEGQVIKGDTITPTLIFRVEVVRTLKPLTEEVVDVIRKIAGDKGLDIKLLDDGKIDYLIGKFITFETAAAYADLLKRNGYSESHVVAWLGNKEIPVATAKQILEKLK